MERKITTLRIDSIRPDPDQPRTEFNEELLQELATSISENGLLQPISVRFTGEDYLILAGERRWRAHKILGLDWIEAVVESVDEAQAKRMQLLENVVREDLNPVELAKAYQKLLDEGLSMDDLAKIVGKPKSAISLQLNVLKCREDIQHMVSKGHVSTMMAWGLSRLSMNGQAKALRVMTENDMKGRECLLLCDRLQADEAKVEMFPEVEPLTPIEQKARAVARNAFERASQAIAEINAIEADNPGTISKAVSDRLSITIDTVDGLISGLNQIKKNLTVERVSMLSCQE